MSMKSIEDRINQTENLINILKQHEVRKMMEEFTQTTVGTVLFSTFNLLLMLNLYKF
jgi:hypothetical protein